ncbi:STAS domain-containing protein [Dactylosporangium sp. CA-152071]|uniref:STAS domain-containing protein n=1 Tax=Dactylosporangium sp. CA-152071 TaxID=3239933 RepID=UPI003D936DD3
MGPDQQPAPSPDSGPRLAITSATPGEAGAVVLTVVGSLDFYTAAAFITAVREAFDAGANVVRVDLGGVGFCDSSGLAVLVRAHKAAQRDGRRFTICSPGHVLNRMFALTALDTVLDIASAPNGEANSGS